MDANLLVALAAATHPRHAEAGRVFARDLAAGETMALSPAVAAEFLHVLSDPRRIIPAPGMAEALAWLEAWVREVAPVWLTADVAAIELWIRWMKEFHLGRKRLLDTQYAALLHIRGVGRLLTNNPDDFRVFGVFELVTF